jgi:hypothetical protein
MNSSKLLLYVALGAIFWFGAAMLVRFVGPYALTDGNPGRPMLFAATVPITIGFLAVARIAGRLEWHQLLRPLVVMTCTATFLDGIALTWFRMLYADSYEVALFGAALILWGAGMGLCFAYVLEQRGIARWTGPRQRDE